MTFRENLSAVVLSSLHVSKENEVLVKWIGYEVDKAFFCQCKTLLLR